MGTSTYLILDQRLPERLPPQRLRHSLVQARPREDERRSCQNETLRVEIRHYHLEAIPFPTDKISSWNADIFKVDERGARGVEAAGVDLAGCYTWYKFTTQGPERDDKKRESRRGGGGSGSPDERRRKVCEHAVRDPFLPSIDDEVILIFLVQNGCRRDS